MCNTIVASLSVAGFGCIYARWSYNVQIKFQVLFKSYSDDATIVLHMYFQSRLLSTNESPSSSCPISKRKYESNSYSISCLTKYLMKDSKDRPA
jgi:hypothetical protein